LREYEAVSNGLGEGLSPEQMEKLLEKQSRLQEQIEAVNGWELENQLEIAMDALRWPPTDRFRPPHSPARGPRVLSLSISASPYGRPARSARSREPRRFLDGVSRSVLECGS